MADRRAPYRVIVWGPGIVGNAALREIARKPELELAGCLAYSPEKNGRDVGEYLGLDLMGVRMTTDQESVFAMDADCVIFTPNMSAEVELDSDTTDIVCRLLASGKNVVTSIGWWYPILHSKALEQKLEAACQQGGSVLHASGVNPGWFLERIVATMTGSSTSIKYIKCQELNDNSNIDSVDMMTGLGYGQDLSVTPWIENVGDRGYGETLALTCAILGVKAERIETEKRYFVARKDHDLKVFKVPKGTRAGLDYFYHAIVDGRRFLTLEEIWYIDPLDLPDGLRHGDYYTVTIEGEPVSVKAEFELMASVEKNQRFRDGDRTLPAYYATAVPLIQAIPLVCGAKPGILYANNFANYVPDLRDFKSPLIVRSGAR